MADVAVTERRGRPVERPEAFHHLTLDDPAGFVARVGAWHDEIRPQGGRT